MPTVLIATSKDDGRAWLAAQPSAPRDVVIVTPRSPHGARGRTAASVLATPDATTLPTYDDLVADCLPSVAMHGGA
jgi:hypothetical protein